jgi:hypothetical protein
MDLKDNIISFLKKMGIAVAGFIALILFGKLSGLLKLKAEKEKEAAKEAVKEVKSSLNKAGELVNSQDKILGEMKEIIEESSVDKEKLLNDNNNNQENLALNAGFKEKT